MIQSSFQTQFLVLHIKKVKLSLCVPLKQMGEWRYSSSHSWPPH